MKHRDANVRQASLAGPRRVQPPSSARSAAVFAKQRKRSLLEGPGLFEELRALDIRLSRIAASIPFLGPWLIPWRGEMTAIERKRIRTISLTATGLGIVAMAALVFDASSRSLPREKRALSEIQDLGDIVQEFRIRNGVYPDWTMWQRTLEQADPRYYDPWRRAYLYKFHKHSVSIGTLGRDGTEGGAGEDADIWQAFRPPEPSDRAEALP